MEQQKIKDLIEEFLNNNPNLPNPEHQPKQVEFLVKSFLFKKGKLKQ